jgi:SAM-dependent methyltransferase
MLGNVMSLRPGRRDILKLAGLFAAALMVERSHALDAAPRSPAAPGDAAGAPRGANDAQNAWALGGASNFRAIYFDPEAKAAFRLFLTNVYHLYPEDRFHRLIEEAAAAANTDRDIYRLGQERISSIKPFLSEARYGLPALWKQKAEMARQTLELLGPAPRINGYLEIGTTGRYIGGLRSQIELGGDVILLHSEAPSFSPTDVAERGGLGRLGRFVPLDDYAPVPAGAVRDQSLDLVTNFIGFHHAPVARLDGFVASLHRMLRPGGRLIVRDHDVDSPRMNRMVALAHDVFNMGLGADWGLNHQEIRNFTSIAQLTAFLGRSGFRREPRTAFQAGDPTRNGLMLFVKS